MPFLLILLLLTASAGAHTDISTTIKELSAKIEQAPTADLYYRRATEYRALREKKHAIEDLQKALEIRNHHTKAIVALAELYGPTKEAHSLLWHYTAIASSPAEKLESLFLYIRHLHFTGKHEAALKLFPKLKVFDPLDQRDPEIDILHSDILLDLKRPAEAATILKSSWQRTSSIVLRNNWIDTSLTAGQTDQVLSLIENELHSSRLRSSWLIRRARALLILKKKEAALTDLRSALIEIQPRLNPAQPDLTLIADRGLIHALMGNLALAKSDLKILKKSTLPSSSYRLLTTHLSPPD